MRQDEGAVAFLSPAVFWGKTILPWPGSCTTLLRAPQRTGTHLRASRVLPPPRTTQPPANSSWCKRAAWLPEGQQGERCSHACPPYLAPVLGQSGFQLQSQLQEPVLHLDKTVITDRFGLCSQHCYWARTTLHTPENAGGGSDWNGHRLSRGPISGVLLEPR